MGLQIRASIFYLRLGLFCSRLVFVACGKLAWSLLLTVESRFGLFAYCPPTVSKKEKDLNCKLKLERKELGP